MKKPFIFLITIAILSGCSQLSTNTNPPTSNTAENNIKTITATDMTGQTNSTIYTGKKQMEVKTQDLAYFESAKGFLATPVEAGNYPGVIMIHEWWGLKNEVKDTAQQLASEGYNVLAVDLFSGEVATTQDRARQLTSTLDKPKAIENMKAAAAYLRQLGSPKIASLGWCFGGGQSLQLALSGEPLDATILYYGQPETDAQKLATIKWPVLGIFGGKDTSIPVENVNNFKTALDGQSIKNEIKIYPDVGHAFANPSGANYSPKETSDAWKKTLEFLNSNLQS